MDEAIAQLGLVGLVLQHQRLALEDALAQGVVQVADLAGLIGEARALAGAQLGKPALGVVGKAELGVQAATQCTAAGVVQQVAGSVQAEATASAGCLLSSHRSSSENVGESREPHARTRTNILLLPSPETVKKYSAKH